MRAARALPDSRAVTATTVPFSAATSPPSSTVFAGRREKAGKLSTRSSCLTKGRSTTSSLKTSERTPSDSTKYSADSCMLSRESWNSPCAFACSIACPCHASSPAPAARVKSAAASASKPASAAVTSWSEPLGTRVVPGLTLIARASASAAKPDGATNCATPSETPRGPHFRTPTKSSRLASAAAPYAASARRL